jgi:hypothetical protein
VSHFADRTRVPGDHKMRLKQWGGLVITVAFF